MALPTPLWSDEVPSRPQPEQARIPASTGAPFCSGSALHRDLNTRALLYARQHQLLHELSPGRTPSVLFGEDAAGQHGNFEPRSYRAIRADPAWLRRLSKAHTGSRRAQPRADWRWRELDCAGSSDALLMNIFCYPGLLESGTVAALLGIDARSRARFGVNPQLARERNLIDRTEIDMELGGLLFEAKLCESDFQTARPALLARFLGWADVLDPDELPRDANSGFRNYQLIRGVLAAHSTGSSFCVLLDARRRDLAESWHAVLRAVRSATLRCRLMLLTWQELCTALPKPLRRFLAEKYGIEAA